jgi:hypothetical protein
MDNVLRKIQESDETLSYVKLQKELRIHNETFRKATRKLKDEGILDKNSSKAKNVPLRFTPCSKNKYPFLEIPNTYLLKEQLSYKELVLGSKINAGNRKKRQEELCYIRFQKILQYFLLRAVCGTTYAREIVDPSELYKPGQILIHRNKIGRYYSYQDIQIASTDELEKNPFDDVTIEFFSIPGVSIADLVDHRDVGSDRLFSYLKALPEECKTVVNRLVRQGVLVPMTFNEVNNAIKKTEHPEMYTSLLEETRYKIGSDVLASYVNDWNRLLDLVVRRIQVGFMMYSKMSIKERDSYESFYHLKELRNFRTLQQVEYMNMSMAEGNNGVAKVRTAYGVQKRYYRSKAKMNESYRKEIESLDTSILSVFEEMKKNKKEYIEIRNKYPFLDEMLKITLNPILKSVGLTKKDVV